MSRPIYKRSQPTRLALRLIVCALLVTPLLVFTQSASFAAPSGLVAAYAFDEGSGTMVADQSGNGHTGTITNAAWAATGKYGSALQFNGTNARVSIPDAADLHLSTAMTLEAWVNPTAINSAWRDVVYKGNDNYYLEASSQPNSRPAAGTIAGGAYGEAYGTANLPTNSWSFIAATYDGANVRLYVNGSQVAQAARTGTIASSTNPLTIGGDTIYGQYFAGLIDNVRVYNVALTATQIQADQTSAVSPPGPDTTPPTAPASLTATVVSTGEVDLAWPASTDNVGVTGYQAERCAGANCTAFAQIGAPTVTTFKDTTVNASSSYVYRVRAVDAAGNPGGYSPTANATTPAQTYSVGGSVSGLSGAVVLQNNGGNDLSVSANGSFAFSTQLATGAAYAVTVKTNPVGQTCAVSNGSGTVAGGNVTNVAVTCTTIPTYAVGGTISGLSGTLVLRNNGGDDLSVNANGPFSFATKLPDGSAYAVTVKTNPSNQTCSVSNGTGTMAGGNVTSVGVTCAAIPTYSVGGSVSGLSGTAVLQNNGGNDLSVSANGAFAFSAQLASGAGYAVTVKTNPSGQTCSVSNGSGTVAGGNVTNVGVTCTTIPTYSVGGTVSGLSGTVVLQNNGGNDLSVSANGSFAFNAQLATGAAYAVTVKTNPTGQTCSVSNGSGTVAGANVTNVAVACAAGGPTASDDFNRANGGLGASWAAVSDGGLSISSQTVLGRSAHAGDIRIGETYSGDQSSQLEVTSTQLTGGQWIGPAVRMQTNGQKLYAGIYFWNSGNQQLRLYKRISGTWTQLGSSYNSGALAAGTQLKLTATGSTISFLQNGVARVTVTDTSVTGGAPGIMTFGTARADNWVGSSAAAVPTYSVGGSVSGLSGTVVLRNNGGDDLTVGVNGPFAFSTQLANGAAYAVTVKTNPAGQTCAVSNGSGTVAGGNVTNVGVTCTTIPTYSIGGSVSGLSGTVVLRNNGGDDLSVSANGPFAFATKLADGSGYAVTVRTNPAGQTCSVSNGSGAVAGGNVTNVALTCTTTPTYSVGGNVSGLSGTVVLQDNGGDDLSVSANGAFTFATKLADGSVYGVTAKTNPMGQNCTVSGGSGFVAGADVTGVSVACSTTSVTTGSDDFNRPDGGLGASWSAVSDESLSISSQAVLGTSATSGDIRTAETYTGDQSSQVEVTSTQLSGGQWIGPAVRMQNGGQNMYLGIYFWNNGSQQLRVYERSAGTWTQLGGSYNCGALAAGTKLQLVAVGSQISFLQNGVTRITVTDTTLSSGAPGIMAFGVAKADNWAGANASATGTPNMQVEYTGSDANGVASYNVVSSDNGYGTQVLRVLNPTNPAPGVAHNFLFVLPVEPGLGSFYGDGLETLRSLNAQNQYNLTIVEPTFQFDSWYADNPTDANIQYETFMTQDLVPWVTQNLTTTGHEQNWLIGFSKSGIGGQDLMLKHPDLFAVVASWDFPADASRYDQFGSSSADDYGTDANFQANYRLTPAFLDAHKAAFLTKNRIWIGGYSVFQTDMSDYDALLTSKGILHSTETPTVMSHRWDSGWVQIALAALEQDSVALGP